MLALIGTVIAFLLIFLRMPIGFAFGLVGVIGIWYIRGSQAALATLYTEPFHYMDSYIWTTIPLYLLLGYFAMHSKLTEEFYSGVRAWIGNLRGGLVGAIILGNAAFGACCGVSIAAATAFTAISLPETRKYNYSDSLTIGAIAGSCNLSILIPPSFGFIIFGAITGTSIGKLFMGGIFPGLILMAMFLLVVAIMVQRNPSLAPRGPKTTSREKGRGLIGLLPLVFVFGTIIGGLYVGAFTPTEAAGAGTGLVFIIGIARRKLSWQGVKESLLETGLISAMVFFLIIGCSIFGRFLALTGAHSIITESIVNVSESPTVILILIVVMFLVLGTFLDVAALTILIIPIIFSGVVSQGVDPVHLGILMAVTGAVGTISPPFGVVIYALSGVIPDVPLFSIFRASYPFLAVMIVLIVLLIFVPEISLWLPSKMLDW